MTESQAKALREIAVAIMKFVSHSGPAGAHSTVIYLAFMEGGCTLDQFSFMMDSMVKAKLLEKKGDCYRLHPKATY